MSYDEDGQIILDEFDEDGMNDHLTSHPVLMKQPKPRFVLVIDDLKNSRSKSQKKATIAHKLRRESQARVYVV